MSGITLQNQEPESVADCAPDSGAEDDLDLDTSVADMKRQLRSAADRLRLANHRLDLLQIAVAELRREK